MHQVVMQPMSSHLRKNPRDDNEPRASQLIVIFSIWGKKPKDDDELGGLLWSSSTHEKKLWNDNKPSGSPSSATPDKNK